MDRFLDIDPQYRPTLKQLDQFNYVIVTWLYLSEMILAFPLEIECLNWGQVLLDEVTNEREILIPLT